MTTKLEAINTMLSCIGQTPLNTLEGTKSSFTIAALNILEDESLQFQMRGWDFNTEEDYPLQPDRENIIHIPDDILKVKIPACVVNRYVVRNKKLYDKYNHTYNILNSIRASITFYLEFEDLPVAAQNYIKMAAANKFVKRELGSQSAVTYTQQDFAEAMQILLEHELEQGQYTIIPEMLDGTIKRGL